jgi:hypothetical protein
MMVAERIYESVQKLPEPLQAEVLDFVEYLLLKAQREATPEDEQTWASMSLDLAMRGMEDENTPEYTTTDLKEQFA